jgi:phosphatidylserine/phosphatidylglycerophosphate/cardiolipin synthase-like enzyme
VTLAGIGRFDLCLNIARAVARGVRVDIYTDPEFNARLRQRSAAAEAAGVSAEHELELAGARLHYVPRIHSKIVAVDERALCIGSFNWLSAAKGGSYQRHEVSLVHRHGDVGARIDQLLSAMSARRDDAAKR